MEDGKTKSEVAAKYGIPKNTLCTWLKNKDNILETTKKGNNSKRQRLRRSTFANLDQAIFKWLPVVRSRYVAVSALVFKTKVTEFSEKMNVENFKASDGWLDCWKKQFNVSFKMVSCKSNACTDEMVAPWEQITLPTILPKYHLNQIYNAEKFGLFYRAQRNKSLHLKNESCVGGKHSKLRLTGLTAANTVGEKLALFVISKSKKLRCFKNIKHLPCRYCSQKKSWMDSILFEEWVREVDRRFTKEGQKIVLLVDNFPAHPFIDNLVYTELISLPPNTSSKLQLMDQDIIRSLKAHYKTMSIKKLIEAIEKKKPLPEFFILDAMQMLDLAWGKVTTKTVVNCFEKAGISKEKRSEALLDANDPFKDLQQQLDKVAVYNPEFFPEGTTANDIVSVDGSLTSTEPLMIDDAILCDVLDEEGSETEDDTDGVSNEPICPQSSDVRQTLDVLR